MNRLENYRTRSGLTQMQLAEKTGVQQAEISRCEKGLRDLYGFQWLSIAKALNCTIEELLGNE